MKTKILFMVINMNIGGTEKALLNLISELSPEKYEITILLLEKKGGFLSDIPSFVTVKTVSNYERIKDSYHLPPKKTMVRLLKKRELFKAINFMFSYSFSRIGNDRRLFLRNIMKPLPVQSETYDIAVAYAGPMDLISYYILNNVQAEKKYQWIHFDVTKIGFNAKAEKGMYKLFNNVFVVSKEARRKFLDLLPECENKTKVFNNIVSSHLITKQAKEGTGFTDNFDGIRILTVGRLAVEKGQDIAIKTMAKLVEEGYHVKWYCIGEGNARRGYEKLVEELNLQERFIFLGEKSNPYPYMAQCDIYVQPSRHEGYCITLAEARCLNKPIITTDFVGAREQIIDGETGSIVKETVMLEQMTSLLKDRNMKEKYIQNLLSENNRKRQVSIPF